MKWNSIMYIYRTTNKETGWTYIGQCVYKSEKTKWYFGSGNIIKNSIKKHGGTAHLVKEIICESEHLTQADLDVLEKTYIILEKDKMGDKCKNIADGGRGGSKYKYKTDGEMAEIRARKQATHDAKTPIEKAIINTKIGEGSKKWWASLDPDKKNVIQKRRANTYKENYAKLTQEEKDARNINMGKGNIGKNSWANMTPEAKAERSVKASASLSGENNPMWGRFGELNPNYGNRWTDEMKAKQSAEKMGMYDGYKNPKCKKVYDIFNEMGILVDENTTGKEIGRKYGGCGSKFKSIQIGDVVTIGIDTKMSSTNLLYHTLICKDAKEVRKALDASS